MAVNAPPWAAVYLNHNALSTHGFTTLRLFLFGGTEGGQTLHISALDGEGHPIPNQTAAIVLTANHWSRVEVPLASLGVADGPITGFWIQNATGEAAPTFYVDEISLN